jgi:enoyl-CoA hydratase/carnithine racemase
LAVGLVNRVVEPAVLVDSAVNLARQVAAQSPAAVAAAKRLLAQTADDAARQREWEAVLALMGGPDAREGLTAFLERRRPRFRDPGGAGAGAETSGP